MRKLREIYSVMFETEPGFWTEPMGRFDTKAQATEWASFHKSFTVVFQLIGMKEETRFSSKRTLARYKELFS